MPESKAGGKSAVAALGMDPLEAQIRQIVFFDTADLSLNERSLVVRVRRVQGKPADSVVKLRPVVPDELPASVRKSPNFGIEVDAMPGRVRLLGGMKAKLDPVKVKETGAGTIRCASSSAGTSGPLTTPAPSGLAMHDLELLGPINVLKLKFTPATRPADGGGAVVLPRRIPDPRAVDQVRAAEAFHVAAETKAFLTQRGSTSVPSSRPRPRPRSSSSPTS